jgi:hypothetical protein
MCRTTVEFIRGLCKFFEPQITEFLKKYITVLLKVSCETRGLT